MSEKKGVLVVISGFSGAGKGTVIKSLMDKYPGYTLSVSVTTREPREGEVDGIHYFFRTRDQFLKLIEEDALLEYAEYLDQYYGTPLRYVEEQLSAGKDVILEIETVGAVKVIKKFPDIPSVFLTPPDFAELRERLLGRGTETPEQVEKRLVKAKKEAAVIPEYKYIVVNENGKIEECAEQLHRIIQAEKCLLGRNKALTEQLLKEAGHVPA